MAAKKSLYFYFYMVIFDIEDLCMEAGMDREAVERIALDIMRRAEMLALATNGGEPYPQVRALFNLRNPGQFPGLAAFFEDKGLAVYLGTNTSSIKAKEVGVDPWVTVYFVIPAEIRGLALSGKAVIDPGAREELWVEDWERYYPSGRHDPDYTILRIDPLRARGWSSGQSFDTSL
jgi:general stress protein 26